MSASLLCLFIFSVSFTALGAPTVRIKDIATLSGVRENQLLGIGLVTGLAGRGDSSNSALLQKTLSNLMASFGFQIDPQDIRSKNCAVVMVSSEVPAFARAGERVDLSVSSIGDARSLEGGILLQTNLQAANGEVYAVAQGRLVTATAAGTTKTVGTVPKGAIVERDIISRFVQENRISMILRNPDFVTANTVAQAVRAQFEGIQVQTLDASLIEVEIPEPRRTDVVSFISELESLTITPDVAGKVVIDSVSGVIIVGENVRIGKVAVSYKSIKVSVGTSVWDEEDAPTNFVMEETASVDDLISTLRTVGLEAEVILGIMQAIDRAGALYGRLIVL
jgi:flagellar P-ring protein precursor FlgI